MHLVMLIIGVTLFPKADALKCYACGQGGAKERCNNTQPFTELGKEVDCPGYYQCAAFTVVRTNLVPYPSGVGYNKKNCLPADQCVSGTVTFGDIEFYENVKCCSTDLCNNDYRNDNHSSGIKNGKKCYTCTDPQNCSDTQKTLSCLGNQTRCMSVLEHNGGQNMTLIGCATQSMCGDKQALLNMFIDVSVSKDAKISCCEDDLCNSVKITSVTKPQNHSVKITNTVNPRILLILVASLMLATWS